MKPYQLLVEVRQPQPLQSASSQRTLLLGELLLTLRTSPPSPSHTLVKASF